MGKRMLLTMGLAAMAVLAFGAASLYQSKKTPARIEEVGPFEVVTHTTRHAIGWNTGRLGSEKRAHYSLRFRGQSFSLDGKAGMWGDQTSRYKAFHSVITFPSPEPALIVHVGDPNNSGFFYLVREQHGEAVVQYLGQSSGGISVEWIDPPAANSPQQKAIALQRKHLTGGRWLLLGEFTVFDTQKLKSFPLQPAKGFSPNNFKPVIAMSPEGRSFVRFGYSMDSTSNPLLAVFEIESGNSYSLIIDKARMRYNEWVDIDAAWIDHHFEWKKTTDGHVRLMVRPVFIPLPYRGQFSESHGYREYNLEPVKPAMRDRFIAFLESKYGAKIQARDNPHSSSDTLMIGQKKINVLLYQDSLGIWMERGVNSQFVQEIAEQFDAVLATGELDDLFKEGDE